MNIDNVLAYVYNLSDDIGERMQRQVDDIYAECGSLFEDVNILQECADKYFDFAYLVKDDHIKRELSAAFSKNLEEWRKLYSDIVATETCSVPQYNSFFAMGKRLQQTISEAMDREYIVVKDQASKYAEKLAIGISYVQDAVDSMVAELGELNVSTQNKKLVDSCREKLTQLKQKLKGIDNEFKMVEKSLDSKLKYSAFTSEILDELNQKSRVLKTLSSQEMFEEIITELQSNLRLLKEVSSNFYSEIKTVISESEDIQREASKCKQLVRILKDSPATVGLLLQNKKNLLKTYVEKDCGSLIVKTKLKMMQNSNNFEQLYSDAASNLYKKMGKSIQKEEDSEFLYTKKAQIEKLHEEYIKQISPLYSMFCSGWSGVIADNVIETK